MKTSNIIILLLFMFVTGPIWYYLLYKMLVAVQATELMWFLYYIYVPVAIVGGIIAKVADKD
jgi:hypothetical protein